MIRRPVAEKSLSHCTEVACTLRKPQTTTIVVRYTDSLSHRQYAELLSTSANRYRYLWKSRDPTYWPITAAGNSLLPPLRPLGYESCHNPVLEHGHSFHLLVRVDRRPGPKTVRGRHWANIIPGRALQAVIDTFWLPLNVGLTVSEVSMREGGKNR